MIRTSRTLVLVALLATPLFGAEPVARIAGKASVPAGYPVFLDGRASVSDPDKPLTWKWKGAGPEPLYITFDKDGRANVVLMVPDPPSGTLRFALVAVGTPEGGSITADADVFDVLVGQAPVPPGPVPPGPTPPVPPVPPGPTPIVAGPLYVSYIVDAGRVTAAQAAIRTSPAVRSALKALDARWNTYQSDEEDLADLRARVAPVGYPSCVIQAQDGRIVEVSRVSSADQIIQAVKRLRGQ